MRFSPSRVAFAVVGLLALAGCGAQVPPYYPYVGSSGPQASSGPGGPQAGVGGGPVAGAGGSVTGASGGTVGKAGSTSGAASPAAVAALTPGNFNFDPAAEAAYCRYSSANRASVTGVTPTSITFGNVSGLTGLLSNSFNQGPEAVQALFAAVNANGGICGRKLLLDVEDDSQDASHNAADVADLIPKSLAFVGSTSDADNGGVPEMVQANIPDIGQAINENRNESPVYYTAAAYGGPVRGGVTYMYNSLMEGLKAYHDFPTKIAMLSYSVPISASAAQQYGHAFASDGAQICYSDYSVSPASPNLDADVLQMQSNGCNGVFTTMDVSGNAKLMQAMNNQGFHPVYAGTTFDGYTPTQIQTAGQQAAQGFQVYINFQPFNENNPGVQMYLRQLQTYEPGKQPSAFGLLSWACAQMVIYSLVKSGPNPTRASLVNALNGLDNFSADGATPPVTPKARTPVNTGCIVEMAVKGNDFSRVWPASGFFCQGQLVPTQ